MLKKLLKIWARWSSSEIISSLKTPVLTFNVISSFNTHFSENNGLTLPQNFLLSVISGGLRLPWYANLTLFSKFEQKLRCFLYAASFSLFQFFLYLFKSLVRFICSFRSSFVTKGWLFTRTYFILRGAFCSHIRGIKLLKPLLKILNPSQCQREKN